MNKQTQEALKMAIEVLEDFSTQYARLEPIINACKQALEQPAQEPVAWIEVIDHHGHKTSKVNLFDKGLQLADGTNLYTHPHQWQGLTDDENEAIIQSIWEWGNAFPYDDYRICVEQALKEKNHG